MKQPQPIQTKYCAFCCKVLKAKQDVYCSDYHHALSRTMSKIKSFTPDQRKDYLRLNSSEAAYEAIKLIINIKTKR